MMRITHLPALHLFSILSGRRKIVNIVGIIILISMVLFVSSSVPIHSLHHPFSFDPNQTTADNEPIEPSSLMNFGAQENDTLPQEEDPSVMPMVLSGIVILLLVMIISYFTLKEEERQKRLKRKGKKKRKSRKTPISKVEGKQKGSNEEKEKEEKTGEEK